jgi:hypothetical protein
MKNITIKSWSPPGKNFLLSFAIASITTIMSAYAQTPSSVDTRIGTLTFDKGYPTPETSKKLFDEMDFQRAVQAYLWSYPLVSFQSILLANKKDYGLEDTDFGIADKFMDTKSRWLTANSTTIYAYTNVDLGKSGPMVVEVPPGQILGIINDFFQRSLTDIGLAGPDGDKGGKYLLLPPGYKGEVPKEGYHVLQALMNNYNIMVRGLVSNFGSDVPVAVERVKKMKVYPWSERNNPKANKFVSVSGKKIDTTPPAGLEYWARLSTFINNNPIEERDRFFIAMLKPLGIEKGKPFQPDARQKMILEQGAKLGEAMSRNMLFDGEERISGATAFSGTHWNWVVLVNPKQETEFYSQIDERIHYTYGAIYTSPGIGVSKAGPWATYIQTFKDKDGNRFDGGKSYKMHLPANIPAATFWSLTIYSSDTRSMLENPSNLAAHSLYDKLKPNSDGSIDLYFGPKAPAGLESNWVETVSGKGFYPMLRLYGPKAGAFDGTWKLPDVELVK